MCIRIRPNPRELAICSVPDFFLFLRNKIKHLTRNNPVTEHSFNNPVTEHSFHLLL